MISYDKLSDGIIELKGQLSALQQKANENWMRIEERSAQH